jgi:hypothetical protein
MDVLEQTLFCWMAHQSHSTMTAIRGLVSRPTGCAAEDPMASRDTIPMPRSDAQGGITQALPSRGSSHLMPIAGMNVLPSPTRARLRLAATTQGCRLQLMLWLWKPDAPHHPTQESRSTPLTRESGSYWIGPTPILS